MTTTPVPHTRIAIEWHNAAPCGTLTVHHGELSGLAVTAGTGACQDAEFTFKQSERCRLKLTLHATHTSPGPGTTRVSVGTAEHPFSFFLRDVTREHPIWIPEYGVVVLPDGDDRSLAHVESAIRQRGLTALLDGIDSEPEESFASASSVTRNQSVPTWLGISRDIRLFQVTPSLDSLPGENDVISLRNAGSPHTIPETDDRPVSYLFACGRGQGVERRVSRRLEDGVLPILHQSQVDGEIRYELTTFVTLEARPLRSETPIGTDFLVADNACSGHMFTEAQQKEVDARMETHQREAAAEETVLYSRVTATNTGEVPRYAFFKTARPGRGWWDRGVGYTFDPATGFSAYSDDRVCCVSAIDGQPLPNEELAILLQPGERAGFTFLLPHSPVSRERAARLAGQSFDTRLEEARAFWRGKLHRAARIQLPEKRIEEMIQAGLLHLDLISYGKEPAGTLAPSIGIYSPIGTESAPIVQFFASMGHHDTARRAVQYFLDKQHDDGLIQNFGGYMVETGAALWSVAEIYRHTDDRAWIHHVLPKLLKSCDYLLNWRKANQTDEQRERGGYGLIAGKVADPEDPFHQFMLNGYGWLGVNRMAEILEDFEPVEARRLQEEADAWRADIRHALDQSMAKAPVVPLGDGSWCPTAAPWTEAVGPRALYAEAETFYSHGTFTVADLMLGPLHLVFCEVVEPDSPVAERLLRSLGELFLQDGAAYSQPYYSRHNAIQLRQSRVKAFLKAWYRTFSALADRETYTFWEHLYQVSPHKTHEEAWFLMETRWMLWIEEDRDLRLLAGIPRCWLADGEEIVLENASSAFGTFSLEVTSRVATGTIEANLRWHEERQPETVHIRLPHPEGKAPETVERGEWDAESECVRVSDFAGEASIVVRF